jgi:hypothetical protein
LDAGIFGENLRRYLELDANGDDPYNFSRLERIYMLNYIGSDRPASMNIVGATSPATLFFSSANDLSYISRNISFGQHRPFSKEYQPLYKRDFEFQKYLYAFRQAYGECNFHRNFPEVDNYLIRIGGVSNYTFLTQMQKDMIDHLDTDSINQYEPIIAVDESGIVRPEILGRRFHNKRN